jgi:hypothetical protein
MRDSSTDRPRATERDVTRRQLLRGGACSASAVGAMGTASAQSDEDNSDGAASLTLLEAAAFGGGGSVLAFLAMYALVRLRREPDEEDQTAVESAPGDEMAPPGDAPPDGRIGPEEHVDNLLEDARRKLKTAEAPYEKEKYTRALEFCEEAIHIARDAREDARAEAPGRVEDAEKLLQQAVELREAIKAESDEPVEDG